MPATSKAVSRNIRVSVQAQYVEQRSAPHDGLWFFAYRVELENLGEETVQLLSRHWVITDGNGRVEEVRGPGVVGEQPVLEPGDLFHYTSACPLPTPFGVMHGSYQMITETGDRFDAEVAPFSLSQPHALN
jgi:ApaG protein